MSKIIFQDVAGPLIPGRMYFDPPDSMYDAEKSMFKFDPIAVNMLNRLCSNHGAHVVFNSAHQLLGGRGSGIVTPFG